MAVTSIESPALVTGVSEPIGSALANKADPKADANADPASTHEPEAQSQEVHGAEARAQQAQAVAKDIANQANLPEFRTYDLSFELDRTNNRVIVHVVDSQTGEVVRSIPPDSVLQMLKQMHDGGRGVLLDAEG